MSVALRVRLTVLVSLSLLASCFLAVVPSAEAAPATVPNITAPANAATVTTESVNVSATSTAASVTFVLDGRGGGFTTSAPVVAGEATATMSVLGLDGATTLAAFDCDGTGCNAVGAEITVNINLPPPILTAPGEGDVVGGSTAATATAASGALLFRVNGSAAEVDLATPFSKTLSLAAEPDGDVDIDAVQCDATGTVCEGPVSGSVTVLKDTQGPQWTDVRTSLRVVYPARDNYRDSTVLSALVQEDVRGAKVEIRKVGAGLVRSIKLGAADAGRVATKWNGRKGNGDAVKSGKYSFRFVGSDVNGRTKASASRVVKVSDKQLVRRSVTKTMTAQGSAVANISGMCGEVFSTDYPQSRFGWPKGVGYYSRAKCNGNAEADIAAAMHRVGVPKAIRYGKATVTAFGAGAFRHPGPAYLLYVQSNKEYGKVRKLGTSLGWHRGGSVPLDKYRVRGDLFWTIATTRGKWYDIKEFRVSLTYYVLR